MAVPDCLACWQPDARYWRVEPPAMRPAVYVTSRSGTYGSHTSPGPLHRSLRLMGKL